MGVATTDVPGRLPARVMIDQQVCGTSVADDTIVRSATGQVANAVITVTGVPTADHPSGASIMNERCRFSPHVQIVRPNASVTTSSRDAVLHTTHAQYTAGRAIFNVALPRPGITLTKPVGPAGIVRISCQIHPWMRGWVVVTDELAAVSEWTVGSCWRTSRQVRVR